jgi:hypothetical protein
MDAHRNLALAAMQAMNAAAANDFMNQAKIPMPEPIAPGALPGMARETVPAEFLHMLVDVDMVFTIADFEPGYDCSAYYDPSSPWYNVFYGAYGLRSYKSDGTAWGYNPDGTPNFDEFLQVPKVDYNFLTAGMFGCPPEQMCFEGDESRAGVAERLGYDRRRGERPVGAPQPRGLARGPVDVRHLRRPGSRVPPRSRSLRESRDARPALPEADTARPAADPATDFARLGCALSEYKRGRRSALVHHQHDGIAVLQALRVRVAANR